MRNQYWIPNGARRAVAIRDAGVCQLCKQKAARATLDRYNIPKFYDSDGIAYEIDHIKPISQAGKSSPENMRLLCRKCNRSRAKVDIEAAKDLVSNW